MQLKALAIGLTCEDYLNDKVAVKDAEGYEIRSTEVEAHELQRFGERTQSPSCRPNVRGRWRSTNTSCSPLRAAS